MNLDDIPFSMEAVRRKSWDDECPEGYVKDFLRGGWMESDDTFRKRLESLSDSI